jgi:hypothetical protein
MPKEDAFILANAIAAKHPNIKTFSRFHNFEHYYTLRMDIEELLYNTFVSLGGKPKEQHPVYFVLHDSKTLANYQGDSTFYEIKVANISSDDISFIIDDSMVAYKRDKKFTMYTKETLQAYMKSYTGTIDEYVRKLNEKFYCIEVQIWSDDILPLAKNELDVI